MNITEAYAPTENVQENDIQSFYEDLDIVPNALDVHGGRNESIIKERILKEKIIQTQSLHIEISSRSTYWSQGKVTMCWSD